ncbi:MULTISPECIES: tRNA pseudouridine(13) synthase TruD [unclassified Acinetobacter]|uniref:tRNA pseudouridine(13) synthase TruD n=1 Tax=unclassified Acinetobacter TaxID=196816 RepID=UPI0035BB3858
MQLTYPFEPSIVCADFKQQPSDFVVTEQLDIPFSEQGEHLWVYVSKTNLNTSFIASLLEKWADIPLRDVGYSGLKDRHAITYQWFSLRLPKQQPPTNNFHQFTKSMLQPHEQATILKHIWHHKKLGRGIHKSNHFRITLTNITGDTAKINAQLELIKSMGVPNYFGTQRFGVDGNNITQAYRFF